MRMSRRTRVLPGTSAEPRARFARSDSSYRECARRTSEYECASRMLYVSNSIKYVRQPHVVHAIFEKVRARGACTTCHFRIDTCARSMYDMPNSVDICRAERVVHAIFDQIRSARVYNMQFWHVSIRKWHVVHAEIDQVHAKFDQIRAENALNPMKVESRRAPAASDSTRNERGPMHASVPSDHPREHAYINAGGRNACPGSSALTNSRTYCTLASVASRSATGPLRGADHVVRSRDTFRSTPLRRFSRRRGQPSPPCRDPEPAGSPSCARLSSDLRDHSVMCGRPA